MEVVGRGSVVEDLMKLLEENRAVLVTGIGGIGKTSTAVLCARTWTRSGGRFQHAAFLNMETEETAADSFSSLAKKLKVTYIDKTTVVKDIYEKLQEMKKDILLIFDNIENGGVVNQYVPNKKYNNILILGTSQCTDINIKLYKLQCLKENQSIDLFKILLKDKEKGMSNEKSKVNINHLLQEDKSITDLIRLFDGHPLAITHAAAHIAHMADYEPWRKDTITQYLDDFRKHINADMPTKYKEEYNNNVFVALQINIKKIFTDENVLHKQIFNIMSYLNPDRIQVSLFFSLKSVSEDDICSAIVKINKFSLVDIVRYDVDGRPVKISVHRLVQEVSRQLQKEEGCAVNCLIDAVVLVIRANKLHLFSYSEVILPHLLQKDLSTVFAQSYMKTSDVQHGYGRYGERVWPVHLKERCDEAGLPNLMNISPLFWAVCLKDTCLIRAFRKFTKSTMNEKYFKVICNIIVDLNLTLTELMIEENVDKELIIKYIEIAKIYKCNFILVVQILHVLHYITDPHFIKVRITDERVREQWQWLYELIKREYVEQRAVDDDGNNILHIAAREDYSRAVKLLVDMGVDIEARNSREETPLHVAISGKACRDVVFELCNLSSAVNVVNSEGNTPLHLAVQSGFAFIVSKLCALGAALDEVNSEGNTPLHLAVKSGNLCMVCELCEHGAALNTVNSEGNTPLHLALHGGEVAVFSVEYLCRRGANIRARNHNGKTPYDFAIRAGRQNILGFLR